MQASSRRERPRWSMHPIVDRVVAPALLTVYLCWPIADWGLVGGIPLAPAGALALVIVWLTWMWPARPRGWTIPLALVAVKLVAGGFLLERGLHADYRASEEWHG